MPNYIRYSRLAVLLLLIPLVRSCDDTSMVHTVGFPFPWASFLNGHYNIESPNLVATLANVVFFALLGTLLFFRFPGFLSRLSNLRVFILTALFGIVSYIFGWVLFIPAVAIAIFIDSITNSGVSSTSLIDALSRIFLACFVLLSTLLFTPSNSQD